MKEAARFLYIDNDRQIKLLFQQIVVIDDRT